MSSRLPLPASCASLPPQSISSRFRARLEHWVFRDRYATPDQMRLADALAVDQRLAFSAMINETCALFNTSRSHEERESFIIGRAPWLSAEDRSRLHAAAAFMMR